MTVDFDMVEQAVYEILSADTGIASQVVSIHKRLKDVYGYGDRLPAIGIKCTDISHDVETGEEIGIGICEVVSVGEYASATESSEIIASAVYNKLKHYVSKGAELKVPISGIEVSGMRSIGGDVEGRFFALVHVSFAVLL